jgi:hypothetical protein
MGRLLFWEFGWEGSTGETRQYARPSADVSAGGWTPSTGTDLYAMLDEAIADDVDYIVSSTAPVADTCVLTLSGIAVPQAGTVTIRIRGRFV